MPVHSGRTFWGNHTSVCVYSGSGTACSVRIPRIFHVFTVNLQRMKISVTSRSILTGLLFFCLLSVSAQQPKTGSGKPAGKDGAVKPEGTYSIQQKYSVYFDVNQAKVKPEGYKVLDSVVALLKTSPNVRRIQVNGYADTTGGAEANMELSNRRTDTVSNYITGKNLMQYKVKFASAFFGEKVAGNESDLSQMRRVDIVMYMARPDRDTIIKSGCASVKIKANTFENYNNDELIFTIQYVDNADDMKKYNLSNLDNEGNKLISGGMYRVTATYKGKPVKGILPVDVQVPVANKLKGYNLYTGVEEKGKPVTWKLSDRAISDERNSFSAEDKACYTVSVGALNLNTWYNTDDKLRCNYCNADPFGGLETPDKSDAYAKFGADKSIVVLNDQCFKKVDATKTRFDVLDDLYPETFLNFCNGFLLPGVGDVPQIPKYEREIVKFIDFNVSDKNDTADQIMVKKTKVLIMVPKSKFPAHEGKQYALLPAETRKDDYLDWTTKVVFNDPCQGLVNCDYWVFEAPFTGFYSLLELTPLEKPAKGGKAGKSETDEEETPKKSLAKIKTKKFNNVLVVYGSKEEDKTQTAKFLENKGKHSFNQPDISKKDRKQYASHIFMAYVVVSGKRYAWIGPGSQLKKGLLSGNWKTPKLVYVPDEEWESFVRKACE